LSEPAFTNLLLKTHNLRKNIAATGNRALGTKKQVYTTSCKIADKS
jgi:hypothetical protein